ncbi:MAG TPA: hypothetical protein VMV57_06090 [Terracidiphilus sp.]|nr:hypothetical protein [Terracidiphilus sp.]
MEIAPLPGVRLDAAPQIHRVSELQGSLLAIDASARAEDDSYSPWG